MPVIQIHTGGFDSNFSYLALDENGDAALIDPCGDVEKIRVEVKRYPRISAKYILVTHSHPDHISGIKEALEFFNAPVCAGSAKLAPDITLEDGIRLPFGNSFIDVISTPGHSTDSICYRIDSLDALFTGDTLFIDWIGFCRPATMFKTLREKIIPLPDSLTVYPGHDYGHAPFETLGKQKKTNPYLNTADFDVFRARIRDL